MNCREIEIVKLPEAAMGRALMPGVHKGLESFRAGKKTLSRLEKPLQRLGLYRNQHPRLRKLFYECRSFLYRIRIALTNNDIYRIPTGPVFLESQNGYVYRNIRSHARNEHIQSLASNVPWATPIDWKTHLDSWDSGVEWAIRNLGSGSTLTDEHRTLLALGISYQTPKSS